MDAQHPSVPAHASPRVAGKRPGHHPSGVVHLNTRHTSRFTVVGNHLAQHRELSLLAIGLAVHIQSLPTGARVDIKSLAARFPEGANRIAGALRELEAHGYLRRVRERCPDGQIVTRTLSCNQPGADRRVPEARAPRTPPPAAARPPRRPPAPLLVPQPAFPAESLLRAATELLAGLRLHDPRLLLSARDTAQLAPGVAAWLERGASPESVRHALTAYLPSEPLHRPAAFLAHRLTAELPPPSAGPPRIDPVQNCDRCDRGFHAPEPGVCGDCRVTPCPPIHHSSEQEPCGQLTS
ncbi:helix-turn-helix domain-containing protein [Streptomyces sp. TRM64462]|uniref:helix-turn-helix domain-containing protein n=1 Tax=Streptomyces sp. TRM64462 TaxID=2741726 RepID=UPI0020C7D558|nr:helix-turn-helix domain-containing protein [Streptomyces sp. TRM64462]